MNNNRSMWIWVVVVFVVIMIGVALWWSASSNSATPPAQTSTYDQNLPTPQTQSGATNGSQDTYPVATDTSPTDTGKKTGTSSKTK